MTPEEIKSVLEEYAAVYGPIPPQKYGDILYDYYAEVYPLQDAAVWQAHQTLCDAVAHLPPDQRQTILDAAAALANAQEKAAFLTAFRVSVSRVAAPLLP